MGLGSDDKRLGRGCVSWIARGLSRGMHSVCASEFAMSNSRSGPARPFKECLPHFEAEEQMVGPLQGLEVLERG